MRNRYIVTALLTLSACAPDHRDYDAEVKCQQSGKTPGTPQYDKCVSDEKSAKLMQQNRQEFEQMQQDRQDMRLRQF